MTIATKLAEFVGKSSYDDMSEQARQQTKVRILDALGCAIGAFEGPPIKLIRRQVEDFGGSGLCTLIGGGRTAPDRAAFYNCALVRYLDFNDSYLAKGETCHPSDNLGAVLSGGEYTLNQSGRDLMVALAVAYQVQCRLSDVAPVRAKGFDHTTQGAYAVAAGVARSLGLDVEKTANAIAISGTAYNALRVTRTGALSNWKGLAFPDTAFGATHATFLAMRGVTGPQEVFEGNKGFMDSIAGKFEIDWSKENLERITHTIVKKYNAEVHSQSALEGVMELRQEHALTGGDVERVDVDVFDVAYNIIGGGEEGNKYDVHIKEQADHSLQYMIAVALLDGQVLPEQYSQERINRADVQSLLRRVVVRPNEEYSKRFPEEMPCRISIRMRDGRVFGKEKRDYEGFVTRPMRWETVTSKFDALAAPFADRTSRREIVDLVGGLENATTADLMELLAKVGAASPNQTIEIHG